MQVCMEGPCELMCARRFLKMILSLGWSMDMAEDYELELPKLVGALQKRTTKVSYRQTDKTKRFS